jgi:signal transduction histidine kinase
LHSAEGQGGGFAVRARFPHNGHSAVASAGEQTAGAFEAGLPPARRRDRRGWLVDAALAVAVLAALTLDAFSSGELRGSAALNEAVFVVMASAFAWRRRAPLAAAATVAIAAVALTAFLTPLPALQTGQGALVVMTYLAAAATKGRQAALAFGALGASVAAVMLVYGVPKLSSREVYALATLTVLAWLAGRATRTRALLNRALREKAEALERDREERARAAAEEVRRRIARELHDVVAHSLTVMIVQAGSARRIVDSDLAEALRAAELIEATGREAFAEMRRLLAVMGDEREGPPRAAPPGIESLEVLIERTRAAGLPVELRRDGEARPLPAGIDIAAYRVVQEALTNTIKHAGASHAELVVRYRPDALELLMTDDGHGLDGHVNGTGHGLVGMRERVGVYGGELETGRADGGGFRVRARFPLETRE